MHAGNMNEDDEITDNDMLVDPAEYDPSAISLQDLLKQQQQVCVEEILNFCCGTEVRYASAH